MINLFVKKLKAIARYFYHQIYSAIYVDQVIKWNPEIIHAHDIHTLSAAAKITKKTNAKFIFDSHELETHRNPPLGYLRRWQVERMERSLLPKASGVITVGQLIADHLENTYQINRPLVLYNSPQEVPSQIPDRWKVESFSNVREHCGLKADDIIAVHTGNVAINRGLESLIKTLGIRNRSRKNETIPVHLAMVGRCEEAYKQELLKLAKRENVAEFIHFTGSVAPTQVVNFISTADIAVIPITPKTLSYEYAMPNKLFESAFAGLIILSSNLAELGPFVKANELGHCFDPFSLEDISKKMELAIRDLNHDNRDRSEFRRSYSWERQGEKLIKLYQNLSALNVKA